MDGRYPPPESQAVKGMPLAEDDGVLRRISDSNPNMVTTDRITGERRPSSGVFHPDGDGVSVYSRQVMQQIGVVPADLLVRRGNLLVQLPVTAIRSLGDGDGQRPLDVIADPWPDDVLTPDHPRHAAHALIVGLGDLPKSRRRDLQRELAMLATFVDGEWLG